MSLDTFDQKVLNYKGDPKEFLREFYNRGEVSKNNAYKYLTGIRIHLNKKKMLGSTKATPGTSGLDEVEYKKDGSLTTRRLITLSEEDSKSPKRIMELMGFDLNWELVNCKVQRRHWDTTTKDKEGAAHKTTNHSFMVQLTVKPTQDLIKTKDLITTQDIQEALAAIKVPEITPYEYTPGDLMLELPILDFHLGKLAWGKETGQDYDLKIARELYKETVLQITGAVKRYGLELEKTVFPIGQDYFHIDTTQNTTTLGTQQDTDTRWAKMYQAGIETLVWAIEQLRPLAPVEIMWVPGNHDRILSFAATETIKAFYRETAGVTVDTTPTPRKYIQHGVNLIGYSHGRDEGKRIDTLMQLETPALWAKTKYREWHIGDLHHESAREYGGIIFRRISSITAPDNWHNEKGYKGATRKAQAFIWDKNRGKILTIEANVITEG